MDRFIDYKFTGQVIQVQGLKSNMDRFIGVLATTAVITISCLKSNMDRFIVNKTCELVIVKCV